MAELAFTTGLNTKSAIGPESSYGVETRVSEPLVILNETLTAETPLVQVPGLDGRAQQRQGYAGNRTIAGDIVIPFRYGLGHPFFRYWFGSYTAATGIYTHIPSTFDQSFTWAVRKGATVWSFFGIKINNLVLNATTDLVQMTATVTAKERTKASAINTIALLDRLQDESDDVAFRHFIDAAGLTTIYIGTQDHTLTSADRILPGDFTITMSRPMDQVTTPEGLTQPGETGYPPVTLQFNQPHHTDNKWQDYQDAAVQLQCLILCTHPITGEFKRLYFPNIQVSAAPVNIPGPTAAPNPITLRASEASRRLTSTGISFAASDNSINLSASGGTAATGTLTLTGVSTDGETITIGGRVYEIDTQVFPGGFTPGRVPVDLSAQSTRASQTMTVDTQPTANDPFTIGTTVYTMKASAVAVGEVSIGGSLAVTQSNIVKAVNGTDGLNTAHPTVTIAPFSSNIATVTAKAGGTGGNAIATTETFTAGSNVFGGSTLSGGVSPTAPNTVTALVAAINGDDAADVTAVDGAGDTVVLTAKDVGVAGNSIATTETMANGSWGAATLTGGVDVVELPYCVAGADIWISGALGGGGTNNGKARVLSRTTSKIIIGNASNNGITLVNEAAGATVRLVARSPDVVLTETAA